jgi:hypothetical protein
MSTVAVATRPPVDPAVRAAQNAKLAELALKVPGQEGDALASMIEQLLTAERVEDLDAPWSSQGLKDFLGVPIMIASIKRMVSDIADGPGFYLIITGAHAETGESITASTSAVMVMVQLIMAHTNNFLPAIFIPREAERPTADGYYPMHLEVYRGVKVSAKGENLADRAARLVRETRKARADAASAQEPAPAPATPAAGRDQAETEPGF